jgi:hypothetical protein
MNIRINVLFELKKDGQVLGFGEDGKCVNESGVAKSNKVRLTKTKQKV